MVKAVIVRKGPGQHRISSPHQFENVGPFRVRFLHAHRHLPEFPKATCLRQAPPKVEISDPQMYAAGAFMSMGSLSEVTVAGTPHTSCRRP
jgi:hypothetical protein